MKTDKTAACVVPGSLVISARSLAGKTFTFRDGGGGLFQQTERQCTPPRFMHARLCAAQTTPDSPLVPVHPWRGATLARALADDTHLLARSLACKFAASFDFLIARARAILDYN